MLYSMVVRNVPCTQIVHTYYVMKCISKVNTNNSIKAAAG